MKIKLTEEELDRVKEHAHLMVLDRPAPVFSEEKDEKEKSIEKHVS